MTDCQRLRVVFAGTPDFAATALAALIDSTHRVVGVLTQPDRPSGRGRKLTPGPVKTLALAHDIPVAQPLSLRDEAGQQVLHDWQPDVMVVAAYGLILPQPVLDLPALGCLNIHGSLLPRWRGAAPIQRAILAGDTETGVCIMQMDAGLDTGAVLARASVPITDDTTAAALHDTLAALGARLLCDSLSPLCEGRLVAEPQPQQGVTYADKLSKQEARLNPAEPAAALHRRIMAFNPWPVAELQLGDERIRVWRSRRVPDEGMDTAGDATIALHSAPGTILGVTGDAVRMRCGDGAIDLLELQRPGKRAMAAADFARNASLPGQVFH